MDLVERVEELLASAFLGAMSGWPLPDLAAEVGSDAGSVATVLVPLVRAGRAQVRSTRYEVNPFILREAIDDPEREVELLLESPEEAWVYAGKPLLAGRPELAAHGVTPYMARMAAGDAQLTPVFFELAVLERYTRDPRFKVRLSGYSGSMFVADGAYFDPSFPEGDKVGIQTFGIGYKADSTRVVTVFLCYLAELSARHQGLWAAFEVDEPCKVAYDYYANAMGIWAGSHSVYAAILWELRVINTMASAMGRGRLFRIDDLDAPDGFHTILRSTRRAYYEFVAILDKLLSENIDIGFFKGEITRKNETGVDKNSITMLDEWLRANYRHHGSDDPVATVEAALRRVRRERQEPAHRLADDEHDLSFFAQHDEIVKDTYIGLRTLRLILANHPATFGIDMPDWLAQGEIGFY